jgi:hypothetical protein
MKSLKNQAKELKKKTEKNKEEEQQKNLDDVESQQSLSRTNSIKIKELESEPNPSV